jgi:hypothetical protein
MALETKNLSYSQFQFVVSLINVFGEQMKKLDSDEQHTIACKLLTAWDNHDEIFREHYAHPMDDSEAIQQWFEENKPKIESFILKTNS